MARPLLILVIVPIYWIGALIARAGGFPWNNANFLWGLAILMPAVIAAHYANEYADVETDALTRRTPFSGGSGVAKEFPSKRRLARQGVWFSSLVGISLAFPALLVGGLGPQVLALWGLGAFLGLAYSLPPFKLAWRGWSEAINALIIAILLPLYGFTVQSGFMDWRVVVGCIPFALLIFILILSTNWADREADREVGKNTLSARLEVRHLRRLYWLALLLGFALQPFLIGEILPPRVVWSSFPALPFLVWAATRYTRIHSPLPTVIAMIVLLPLQIWAWLTVQT
jgi:1,4-dihydroxy-2-naphthoate octaprenyltransferase